MAPANGQYHRQPGGIEDAAAIGELAIQFARRSLQFAESPAVWWADHRLSKRSFRHAAGGTTELSEAHSSVGEGSVLIHPVLCGQTGYRWLLNRNGLR